MPWTVYPKAPVLDEFHRGSEYNAKLHRILGEIACPRCLSVESEKRRARRQRQRDRGEKVSQ